jgi:hypothetical protein
MGNIHIPGTVPARGRCSDFRGATSRAVTNVTYANGKRTKGSGFRSAMAPARTPGDHFDHVLAVHAANSGGVLTWTFRFKTVRCLFGILFGGQSRLVQKPTVDNAGSAPDIRLALDTEHRVALCGQGATRLSPAFVGRADRVTGRRPPRTCTPPRDRSRSATQAGSFGSGSSRSGARPGHSK